MLSTDDEFIISVDNSWSLIKKIIDDIKKVHQSCITVESLTTNDDLAKWQYQIKSLSIPADPSISVESSKVSEVLLQVLAGLQLHKGVLEAVKGRLSCRDVENLLADIGDLVIQINDALTHLKASPSAPVAPINIKPDPSDYEVQVITHVTLVRLLHFGQEVYRFLRNQLPQDH